jgi:Bacteriocin-protection, YdeI or OmpD-Associated/Domain of unknown function (DUF1905)
LSTQRFDTVLEQYGTRTVIVVPFDPNRAWGAKDRHYVGGSVNGCQVRGRLDSNGTQFFLSLGPAWRRDNRLEAGAAVTVVLFPEGPQSELLAADIADALEAKPKAKAFFDSLASFYRKNFLRWIDGARRAETRKARISEMVKLLGAGKRQK